LSAGERLVRLLRMINVIQNNPGITAEGIARECGISERQWYRDLQLLESAYVPIYHEQGYRIHEFRLKNLSLTLEEALALIYGIKLVEGQKGIFSGATEVKKKLLGILPEKIRNEIEEFGDRVEVADRPGVDYTGKEELFKKLNEAIRKKLVVEMNYHTFGRDELTDRMVEPYQLVYNDGYWYLVAYCRLRKDVLLFRVDRIKKLELTRDNFIIPEDFDFESYMGAAWQMERGEEFTFQVRFFGEAVRFVQETQFHPTQRIEEEPEGSVVFTAKACGMRSVMRWVLTFGSEAEVIGPEELRSMIKEEVEAGVKRYRGYKSGE